jgi:hypothetical protein
MLNSVPVGILFSCIAFLASASSVAADSNKCRLTRYASLDLVMVADTYLLVPVTIQGARAEAVQFR